METTRSPRDIIGASLERVDRALERARSIDPECYTREDIFDAEVEKVFKPGWLAVGRTSQLNGPGAFFCVNLFGHRLIIVRDKAGGIRALSAICRHRNTLLVTEDGTATAFSCPYHRWTYNLDGSLRGARHLSPAQLEDKDQFRLASYRCELWLGWVMVNLSGDAPALADSLGRLEHRLAPWGIAEMVPLCAPIRFESAFNWKIPCDNHAESYHIPGAHPKTLFPYIKPEDCSFETDDGNYVLTRFPPRGGGTTAAFGRRPPGLPDDFSGTWSINVFPNLLFGVMEDCVVWQRQDIRSGRSFTHELWLLGPAEVAQDPEMASDIAHLRRSIEQVEGEDQACFRLVGKGVDDPAARPGPFASCEEGTWIWQKWLMKRLASP